MSPRVKTPQVSPIQIHTIPREVAIREGGGKASPSMSIFSRAPLCPNTCRHCRNKPCDIATDYEGQLLDCAEKAVPLAPLLRTRTVEAFGIYPSSWTLYQPKALVWHYDFWEGRSNFCTVLNYVRGKLPNTRWENIIPPPFQEAWRAFLEELARPKPSADKLDGHVQQLVPLFACATYEVPSALSHQEKL